MKLAPHSASRQAAAICLLLAVSGCTFGARLHTASSTTITEPVAPSAFVAVVSSPSVTPSLAGLVAATARPGEHLDILGTGPTATVLAPASPPPPARAVLSGKPAAPGPGATPFQQAEYHRSLASWQRDVANAKETVATQTHATLVAWASALSITRKVSRLRGWASDLASECANAADVLADLNETSGASFAGR